MPEENLGTLSFRELQTAAAIFASLPPVTTFAPRDDDAIAKTALDIISLTAALEAGTIFD